jgi:hypothetical protein
MGGEDGVAAFDVLGVLLDLIEERDVVVELAREPGT